MTSELPFNSHGIIGSSPVMKTLDCQIATAAGSDLTVLVTGESGTCRNWIIPPAFRRYSLMPLIATQHMTSPALGNPGLRALAMQLQDGNNTLPSDQVIERWLNQASGGSNAVAGSIVE